MRGALIFAVIGGSFLGLALAYLDRPIPAREALPAIIDRRAEPAPQVSCTTHFIHVWINGTLYLIPQQICLPKEQK